MWVSKEKWTELNDKLITFQHLQNVLDDIKNSIGPYFYGNAVILSVDAYDEITSPKFMFHCKQEENEKDYKQLYLNELQKRLELAEMVRKMDGD